MRNVITLPFVAHDRAFTCAWRILAGTPRAAAVPPRTLANRHTFYIETFGCQMNDHDSEKVAGVLLRRGYRQVDSPEEARLVFYNTCSIREKAAQKVFSRLGLFNPKNNLARTPRTKSSACSGCVAQQEGEEIFERAPWVSLVCGSASYRKLPLLLARLEAGERRVTGLDTDTDETFETELDAPRSSVSRLSHHYRGLRQSLRLLRGAVSRAGPSAAVPAHPSCAKFASWPMWATPKFNCWGRP